MTTITGKGDNPRCCWCIPIIFNKKIEQTSWVVAPSMEDVASGLVYCLQLLVAQSNFGLGDVVEKNCYNKYLIKYLCAYGRDGREPHSRGLCTHEIRIPIRGLDDHPQYKEFWP